MPGYFLNDVNSSVDDSLIGYVRAHSNLELIDRAVITRTQIPSVAVISGNSSGHEPAMVGFVGRGLLSACISGSIFVPPSSSDIFRLLIEINRRGAKQILLIVLNYTGDRLNFGLAMERARELSIDIDMLVIADDAAVDSAMGPRGLAGALLIIKIAGALAEQGKTMSQIVDVCQTVRGHLRTIALSVSGIRAPGQNPSFELPDNEMQLGMGIQGEVGVQKLKILSSRQATDLAFGQLFRGSRALDIKRGDEVLLFVNSLGGCSNLEFGIVIKDAIENLEHRAFHVKRILFGEMMTAFTMKGFSLTILRLTTEISSNVLNLLDSPTDAFAWPKTISVTQTSDSIREDQDSLEFLEQFSTQLDIQEPNLILEPTVSDLVYQAIQLVIKKLSSETEKLNRMDAIEGDGDTGTAFARAAETLAQYLNTGRFQVDRPSAVFRRLGIICESRMGGTCGAICGLFFTAIAKNLCLSTRQGTSVEILSYAFDAGIQSVESYARVQPGDKSLLDVLIPVVNFIRSKRSQQNFSSQDWKDLSTIAETAAQDTKTLVPKVGRASNAKSVDIRVPDPGAYAVQIIIQAISDVFAKASFRTSQ